MDKNFNLFFDCLFIQADGEYGHHVYYKDYSKEFSFYTTSDNLYEIIDFINYKLKEVKK